MSKAANWKLYATKWRDDEYKQAKAEGVCLIRIIRTSTGKRVHVIAPVASELFPQFTKIYGRWRSRTETWTFHIYQLEKVMILCKKHYGSIKIGTGF